MRRKGQGTVTLRADGRYQLAYAKTNGKRQFHYMPRGTTKKQAEEKLADLLRAADVDLTPDSPLSSFLRRWLTETEGSVRDSTYRHYESIVREHLIPELGRVKLSALNPAVISTYLREGTISTRHGVMRGRALSPRSVHHHLVALRRALRLAEAWRLIDWNPARLVDPPHVERFEGDILTVPQIATFLDRTADDRLYALWTLALTTSMREGEILGLTWAVIDWDAGTLRVERQLQRAPGTPTGWAFVPPKTGSSRRPVVLQDIALVALRAHRARQAEQRMRLGVGSGKADREKPVDGLVFVTEAGKPIHANVLIKELRRALERCGLPRLRFHDLRDTAITWAIDSGADLEDIKHMAGHATIRQTSDTYGHRIEQRQREVAGMMAARLARARTEAG